MTIYVTSNDSSDLDRDPDQAQRLGQLMHRLHGVLGPSPADFVDTDLPRQQLRALFVVARHGPISIGGLARATHATLASTSSLADRLARSGHVEREPDPADRRRVLLTATAGGRAIVDRFESRFRQRFECLIGAMSPEARTALEAGLSDILRAADELGMRRDDARPHGGDET